MSNLKFWVKWAATNAVSFWVPMYLWLVNGSDAAGALFAVVLFMHFASGMFYSLIKNPDKESHVIYAQDVIHDAGVAVTLFCYGEMLAGCIFLTSCILMRVPVIRKAWGMRVPA
jgi:hypothetical protein